MNFKVEEILMVVIAFLIGWFLSNMIPGSSLGSGLRVKAVGGKHDATVGGKHDEIVGDNYIPMINIQSHLSKPGLGGGGDKTCNDVPWQYRMTARRDSNTRTVEGPNTAICNTMYNSSTGKRCTQKKVKYNERSILGWQDGQEQNKKVPGHDEQCVEGDSLRESPIKCSKLHGLESVNNCSEIKDKWITTDGEFKNVKGAENKNFWNQSLCKAFYEKNSKKICESMPPGAWDHPCKQSNVECIE